MSTEPFDEARDATRRTRLASERTYLAWWRSGLTALAVSLGAGKLIPEVAGGVLWPFQAVGAGFGVLGVAFIVHGHYRQRAVEAALRQGDYAPLSDRLSLLLTAAGVVLSIATILIVVVSG